MWDKMHPCLILGTVSRQLSGGPEVQRETLRVFSCKRRYTDRILNTNQKLYQEMQYALSKHSFVSQTKSVGRPTAVINCPESFRRTYVKWIM